jgi:hypothetical protein
MNAPEYFLACDVSHGKLAALAGHKSILVAVNLIKKKRDIEDIKRWAHSGIKIIIDSGAFDLCSRHAMKHNIPLQKVFGMAPENIDGFAKLFEDFDEIARELQDHVFAVIEIDLGGKKRKRATRQTLEDKGLKVCPVIHPMHDGWDYLDELATKYDKIFVGNLVDANVEDREIAMGKLALWRMKNPKVWIHLLGVTPSPLTTAMPPNSADSSAWYSCVRQFSSWRAFACYEKIAGFGRDMAYVKDNANATHEKAKRVAALQCRVQELGIQHYFKELHS